MDVIFIDYDPWSRMGNRMFQFALGYILTWLKCGYYVHDGLPNFSIPPFKSDIFDSLREQSIHTRHYGDHYVDFNFLVDTERPITINSYVQKASYYVTYKDILCNAFNIKPVDAINQNKLVLHVRETDYTQVNAFLGYSVYKQIIDEAGFSDVIIVTDNSECDTVKRLIADGCTLNTQGTVNTFSVLSDDRSMYDFYTLLNSENIAISQSSYSWWAAFLGSHKNVFFPFVQANGMWKINPGEDDIDLFFESPANKKIII